MTARIGYRPNEFGGFDLLITRARDDHAHIWTYEPERSREFWTAMKALAGDALEELSELALAQDAANMASSRAREVPRNLAHEPTVANMLARAGTEA